MNSVIELHCTVLHFQGRERSFCWLRGSKSSRGQSSCQFWQSHPIEQRRICPSRFCIYCQLSILQRSFMCLWKGLSMLQYWISYYITSFLLIPARSGWTPKIGQFHAVLVIGPVHFSSRFKTSVMDGLVPYIAPFYLGCFSVYVYVYAPEMWKL